MVGLGQLVEGLVFNPPAPVPRWVDPLRAVALQSVAGAPAPLTCAGRAAFDAAAHPGFLPALRGAHDAERAPVALTQPQVFDLPQLHLLAPFLIRKRPPRLFPLA